MVERRVRVPSQSLIKTIRMIKEAKNPLIESLVLSRAQVTVVFCDQDGEMQKMAMPVHGMSAMEIIEEIEIETDLGLSDEQRAEIAFKYPAFAE